MNGQILCDESKDKRGLHIAVSESASVSIRGISHTDVALL